MPPSTASAGAPERASMNAPYAERASRIERTWRDTSYSTRAYGPSHATSAAAPMYAKRT